MVRTKDHASSAVSGAKKTHKGYKYLQKTMHVLAMLSALGALIASAIAAHKAHNLRDRGGDGDDDDDGGHYKMARNVSIAAAVWSGIALLHQGGSGGAQWRHAKKLQKARKLRRGGDDDYEGERGLNGGHMGVGAVNTGHGASENRRRRMIDIALQALVVVFGVVVLAIWARPLMRRTYRDAGFRSALKAWGILGWIALALLILLLLAAIAMLLMRKNNNMHDTDATYGNTGAAYGGSHDAAYGNNGATYGNTGATYGNNAAYGSNAAYGNDAAYANQPRNMTSV